MAAGGCRAPTRTVDRQLVLDEYALPAQFAAVSHDVFAPVPRSLTLLARPSS
ncbi:MAG: hypothetical protein ACR2NR_06160 [Solirubrobacteraceae bacterium]